MTVIRVFQSWDDGVVDDIRFADLCRQYDAKASFNLNPGLHEAARGHGWQYGNKEVLRLARGELEGVYAGFEIANHTSTHPDPLTLDSEAYSREIADARKQLQDWFGQPVDGFCYPYGRANQAFQDFVEQTGHTFARDAEFLGGTTTGEGFRRVRPHCHFTDARFWNLYADAVKSDGCFFFWGHTYELVGEEMWRDVEEKLRRISADPDAEWVTLGEYCAV